MKFLTKGDNNNVDDRGLYAPGQLWLTKKDIVGRARGFLPYVGIITIFMNEYPKVKVGPLVLSVFFELILISNSFCSSLLAVGNPIDFSYFRSTTS